MLSVSSPISSKNNALFVRMVKPTARRQCLSVRAENTSKSNWKTTVESIAKPIALSTLSTMVLTLPAYAEAGKLFDFNLTLPIMAAQFLLLMFFLDKTWFSPVGDLLDKRDKLIRDQLTNVSDKTDEIERLEREAEEIIRKARQEAQAAINQARGESEAANAEKYAAAKSKVDSEIEVAFAELEREKETAIERLQPEIEKLSDQVIQTILPAGVTL